ncbi:3-hydroxyacyl-CoA dehydrogenase, partial [Escherichia coli]|nr:3-hydroxyacyl-CoA dehydrogenase [Escherichia coli]
MNIQGNHFVITGGGSGLGAATAEYLVKQGASVTLVDMNVEAGEQQARQLGSKADFVKLDVTDEAAAEQFF